MTESSRIHRSGRIKFGGVLFRCFLFSFIFPLIGFKLGDDLLGVAHLSPCDLVVQIWWQLVLIWPQIGFFFDPGDFWVILFVLISRSANSLQLCRGQSTVTVHVVYSSQSGAQ